MKRNENKQIEKKTKENIHLGGTERSAPNCMDGWMGILLRN